MDSSYDFQIRLLCVLFMVLLNCFGVTGQSCNDSNTQFSRQVDGVTICYDFTGNNTMDWTRAQNYCESIGGNLAVIEDQETQDFLNTGTVEAVLGRDKQIWIGGYLEVLPDWEWMNGAPLDNVSGWAPDSPDTGPGLFYVYMSASDYLWESSVSAFPHGYVCQYTNAACVDSTTELLYNDTCFRISNEGKTWFESASSCQDLDQGMLATVNDEETFTALQTKMKGTDTYWIGLHLANWMWIDGEEVLSYTNWNSKESPLDSYNASLSIFGDCGTTCPDYVWYALEANGSYPALCQTTYYSTTTDSVESTLPLTATAPSNATISSPGYSSETASQVGNYNIISTTQSLKTDFINSTVSFISSTFGPSSAPSYTNLSAATSAVQTNVVTDHTSSLSSITSVPRSEETSTSEVTGTSRGPGSVHTTNYEGSSRSSDSSGSSQSNSGETETVPLETQITTEPLTGSSASHFSHTTYSTKSSYSDSTTYLTDKTTSTAMSTGTINILSSSGSSNELTHTSSDTLETGKPTTMGEMASASTNSEQTISSSTVKSATQPTDITTGPVESNKPITDQSITFTGTLTPQPTTSTRNNATYITASLGSETITPNSPVSDTSSNTTIGIYLTTVTEEDTSTSRSAGSYTTIEKLPQTSIQEVSAGYTETGTTLPTGNGTVTTIPQSESTTYQPSFTGNGTTQGFVTDTTNSRFTGTTTSELPYTGTATTGPLSYKPSVPEYIPTGTAESSTPFTGTIITEQTSTTPSPATGTGQSASGAGGTFTTTPYTGTPFTEGIYTGSSTTTSTATGTGVERKTTVSAGTGGVTTGTGPSGTETPRPGGSSLSGHTPEDSTPTAESLVGAVGLGSGAIAAIAIVGGICLIILVILLVIFAKRTARLNKRGAYYTEYPDEQTNGTFRDSNHEDPAAGSNYFYANPVFGADSTFETTIPNVSNGSVPVADPGDTVKSDMEEALYTKPMTRKAKHVSFYSVDGKLGGNGVYGEDIETRDVDHNDVTVEANQDTTSQTGSENSLAGYSSGNIYPPASLSPNNTVIDDSQFVTTIVLR